MARDGSGNYSKPVSDFSSGSTISSSDMNSTIDDIATALTGSIAKNGETTVTGNIPMGSKKLTGLTTGSANTDSLTLGQAQDSGFIYAASSGTDTITLTLSPAVTAYATGQVFRFKAGGDNTGAATLNVNAVGAKAIQMNGSALAAGAIETGKFYEVIYDGTQFQLAKWEAFSNDLPPTWLSGCTISNGTDADHDIDIAAGVCVDSTDAVKLTLGFTLPKQIDVSWAEDSDSGVTPSGGFPTGISLSPSTKYHVFVIRKTSDGSVDAGFDTSITAANLLADATDYSEYRRIGSVQTDASSNILAFVQTGNEFTYADPILDVDTTSLGTSSASYTLSVPAIAGTVAKMNVVASRASNEAQVYVRDLNANDEAASGAVGPLFTVFSHSTSGVKGGQLMQIPVNGSAQIAARSTGASTTFRVATLGWIDKLGRDW